MAVALLGLHAVGHNTLPTQTAPKLEKIKRLNISSAGTSEDWVHFLSHWRDYTEATKVTGKDKVVQLLECCDEQLHKDLTQNASGTLINKIEAEVLTAIKKTCCKGRKYNGC